LYPEEVKLKVEPVFREVIIVIAGWMENANAPNTVRQANVQQCEKL
jgi:hypothetical protein